MNFRLLKCFTLFAILVVISSNFLKADPPTENEIYEEYAISQNREEIIKKLIPGTEIYYFLHTLHYQQTGKLKEAEDMLTKWFKTFPYSANYTVMKNRQKILMLDNDTDNSFIYLRDQLGLSFNHAKPYAMAPKIYPSDLKSDSYNAKQTINNILSNLNNLSGLTNEGLYEISSRNLSPEQIRLLLTTYSYPDLPNITDLIIKDFDNFNHRNFGDISMHNNLTLKQLNELKEKRPALLTHEKFVCAYIKQFIPPQTNFAAKPLIYKKYLIDCYNFVKDLNPSFNTLKATFLSEYLDNCLETNSPDFALFKEFIKLPRTKFYANVDAFQKKNMGGDFIQYHKVYEGVPIPPINQDEKLIEIYLYKYIQAGNNTNDILPYFEKSYLQRTEAETKITTGQAKPEDFLSILQPQDMERIRNSVTLSFTRENQKTHKANDDIKLYMQIKNCPEIEIQIFQINALDYYRNKDEEISQNISLEGYIPNIIKKINYTQPSHIKHEEQIEIPEIKKPGVYVVEVLGNGVKTRAFIRKGNLYPSIYSGNNGHEIRLFDDSQNPITSFTVYFGKHQLVADKNGLVKIPFASPKNTNIKSLIFSTENSSCYYKFSHKGEIFELNSLILNQTESLLPGQNCRLLSKLILKQNDKPIETKLLYNVSVLIQLFNSQNQPITSQTYPISSESDLQEFNFQIPEKTTSIQINYKAKIKRTADDEEVEITTSNNISLSGSNYTNDMLGLYLRKQNDLYQIECLNKAGIPQPNISIYVNLTHKFLRSPLSFTLQTDAKGVVTLNDLNQITFMQATLFNGPSFSWNLKNKYTYRPNNITCLEKEMITVPFRSNSKKIKEEILLLKIGKNDKTNYEDKTDQIKYENNNLILPTETEGDYKLIIKSENTIVYLNILKGKKQNHYIVTEDSISDETTYLPHQILLDAYNEKTDSIKGVVMNSNDTMKVYCLTGHYYANLPLFTINFEDSVFDWPNNTIEFDRNINQFFESIRLSSEFKYIAQRKTLQKFPGNNLPMPSSLLNPWDVALADKRLEGSGGGGGSFGQRNGGGRRSAVMKGGGSKQADVLNELLALKEIGSLNFFKNAMVSEIKTQKDGSFELSLKDKKDGSFMQILVVSAYGFYIHEIAFPSSENKLIEVRQVKNKADIEDKLPALILTNVAAEKPATFNINNDKQFLKIDTLPKLKSALDKILNSDELSEFGVLTKWLQLNDLEKLNFYKKYACHELHFYIYQKDKTFFNKHIKPFIKNKQYKTLIDKYILDEDLSMYTELNQFNQLNTFEKILLVKKNPNLKDKFLNQLKENLDFNKPNREREIEIMERLLNGQEKLAELQELGMEVNALKENFQSNYKVLKETSADETRKPAEESKKQGYNAPTAAQAVLQKAKAKNEAVAEKELRKLSDKDAKGDSDFEVMDAAGELKEITIYRDLKDTKEYAEANYYHLVRGAEYANLVPPSKFWIDYLNHNGNSFISESILGFTNIHEALLAMALIDLPETNTDSQNEIKDNQIIFSSKSPMIVLLKSFKSGNTKPGVLSLQQHYFYREQNDKKIINTRDTSFVANKIYNCLTILTNTSSEVREVYLNMLVPEGSIPLATSEKSKMNFVRVEPFTSFVSENTFFFPLAGTYNHLPSKAIDTEFIYTNEKSFSFSVSAEDAGPDKESWEFIVKEGNKDKILNFVKTHNLFKTNISYIYYLLNDKDFFEKLTAELKTRFYFDYIVWSYSIYHKDKLKLTEFLSNTNLVSKCGTYFHSPYLKIDPIDMRIYEHREFMPLVKGRAHETEPKNAFENEALSAQYKNFIDMLLYKPKLDQKDYFNLIVYTLNQQKITEALQYFSLITTTEPTEKIQYDYLKAYLALYQSDLKTATEIVTNYKELAIPHWKEKFTELSIQLEEINSGKINEKSRGTAYSATSLISKEAFIKTTNKNGDVEIAYKNLKQVQVDYYQTDIEVLFSNAPFEVMNNKFQFLTTPNASENLILDEKELPFILKIPTTLKNKNLVIKISGSGKEAIANYYPNQMDITISDNYGELRVVKNDSQKPLATVYVKVYGRKDGTIEFIKDGYTDLRGIFSYTSVSGKPIKNYTDIAILVLSENNGASIHYTTPPAQ